MLNKVLSFLPSLRSLSFPPSLIILSFLDKNLQYTQDYHYIKTLTPRDHYSFMSRGNLHLRHQKVFIVTTTIITTLLLLPSLVIGLQLVKMIA